MQTKAARFVINDYSRHSSVTDMLNQLNWQSLKKQRDDLTLSMFYKIINQHIDAPCDHILQKPFNFTHSGSRKFLQELILLNILSFLEQSDYGITYQITL